MFNTDPPGRGYKLHWTQKVALIRHNLHAATRARDFTFFRTLQAQCFIAGTDLAAALHDAIGPEADSVLATLDNLNAGVAYVYRDAFKAVMDSIKAFTVDDGVDAASRRASITVDMSQQMQMADFAIDRMVSSTVHFIEAHPSAAQDIIVDAWILGTTVMADAVDVCLSELDALESRSSDFIRLEYSWSSVQSAVDSAVSALKGIFHFMASDPEQSSHRAERRSSVASNMSQSSVNMLRRLSTAFSSSGSSTNRSARSGSVTSMQTNPMQLHNTIAAACPTSMPPRTSSHTQLRGNGMLNQQTLDTIPPTPTPTTLDLDPFSVAFESMAEDGVSRKPDEQGSVYKIVMCESFPARDELKGSSCSDDMDPLSQGSRPGYEQDDKPSGFSPTTFSATAPIAV